MIGNHKAPGNWYPMYSYATSLSDTTEAGMVYEQINEIKHEWLPRVINGEDFVQPGRNTWMHTMPAVHSFDGGPDEECAPAPR